MSSVDKPNSKRAATEIYSNHGLDSQVSPTETWSNPFHHNLNSSQDYTGDQGQANLSSSANSHFSTMGYGNLPYFTANGSLASAQYQSISTTADPTILPPPHVVTSTINLYFELCHDQPYCFFHEQTFRHQLTSNQLPHYLIFAVLAISLRFSPDPFYSSNPHMAAKYASNAWKEVERQCFDDEDGMDYRLVQAATLLALWDFLACKHETAWIKLGVAVSMAQALHMTKEPDNTLCFSAQEERRRTLWSIYLFDKMATCGRDRPSLFRDQTIDLQLPCSDTSFWMSTPEKIVTLEGFNSLEDSQIRNLAPSALTIVLASILSQTSNYAFKHNKSSNQKPPWDHTSEYQVICSQLTRFETLFDSYGDIQEQILDQAKAFDGCGLQITESLIFAYVLYNLCHCLLQHPFLLRRRLEECSLTIPTRFFAWAIESGSNHAQEISRTLTNAARAKYRVSATILGYFSLVAASINGLFQHSADETTRMRSAEALAGNLAHIEAKAKHWKTSARMVATLTHFSRESARYSPLIDTSFQTVPLTAADIELLYSLCDYGTISSSRTKDIALLNTNETTPTPLNLDPMLNNAASADTYSNFENLEDFSGLIEGIIPQFFDHTNARTVLDDFSSALGQFGGADCSASGQGWDFHS